MAIEKLVAYSVIPVWLLTVLGAVLILFFCPADQQFLWLSIALAVGAIVTFCIQLGLDRKEGLVNRVMVSLGGSVVILAAATGISALLGGS